MGRFAADYLPLDGAGLFDTTGQMPPACRFELQVPEEYIESDIASWVNLDDMRTALIDTYRPAAQRSLWVFRQERGVGTVDIVRQSRQISPGVFMEYTSQFGRESVRMVFVESLVRKLLEAVDSGLYMLVLYGGNKIAAIPMANINSSLTPDTKKTLNSSSWGSDFGQTLQITTANGYSAISSAFGFTSVNKQPTTIVRATTNTDVGVKAGTYLSILTPQTTFSQQLSTAGRYVMSLAAPTTGSFAGSIAAMDGVYTVNITAQTITQTQTREPPLGILPDGTYVYILGQWFWGGFATPGAPYGKPQD